MLRSVELLAAIRLNLASVEQFLSAACSLADDKPEIRDQVHEAAGESRNSALLIDHLRNLFCHQQSVELRSDCVRRPLSESLQQQQKQQQVVAAPPNSAVSSLRVLANEPQLERNFERNAHLFTYSNQATLVRAAKTLVASVAKILYLVDTVLWGQAEEQRQQQQYQQQQQQLQQRQPHDCHTKNPGANLEAAKLELADRADNVANYSHLLRAFGELSTELVNLGQCIMLAAHASHAHQLGGRLTRRLGTAANPEISGRRNSQRVTADYDSPNGVGLEHTNPLSLVHQLQHQPLGHSNSSSSQFAMIQATTTTTTGMRATNDSPLDRSDVEVQDQRHVSAHAHPIETQLQDMQTLFQVNRLTIDRLILLLLSASKCCLRLNGAELRSSLGLETRRSVAAQIRASMSIIMAIVKCCVFNLYAPGQRDSSMRGAEAGPPEVVDGRRQWPSSTTKQLACHPFSHHQQASQQQHHNQHQHRQQERQERQDRAKRQEKPEAPLEIMGYFLETRNGGRSAHDAIGRLQCLVAPFVRVLDFDGLLLALGQTLELHQAQAHNRGHHQLAPGELELRHFDEQLRNFELSNTNNNNKENNNNNSSNNNNELEKHQMSVAMLLVQDKRQLMAALNSALLGEAKLSLVERVHEFTDCAYTKHEHRETIILLLHCIKLHLSRLVKHVYRSCRRLSSSTMMSGELNLGQLRLLAGQLNELCQELEYELQTVVIEQSDELDRCNSQLDLVKQLKHSCLVGDFNRTSRLCLDFNEQSEQLIEACKMLNQVAQTHKIKIVTKSLAIWFELNLGRLIQSAKLLAQEPQCREAKDCVWAYLQVWCSFYDDFCQVARQAAYLVHSQYDQERAARVAALRDQLLIRRQHHANLAPTPEMLAEAAGRLDFLGHLTERQPFQFDILSSPADLNLHHHHHHNFLHNHHQASPHTHPHSHHSPIDARRVQSARSLAHAGSFHSVRGGRHSGSDLHHHQHQHSSCSEPTDSPRSLDHYHGFGANYPRHANCLENQQLNPFEPFEYTATGYEMAAEHQLTPTASYELASADTTPSGGPLSFRPMSQSPILLGQTSGNVQQASQLYQHRQLIAMRPTSIQMANMPAKTNGQPASGRRMVSIAETAPRILNPHEQGCVASQHRVAYESSLAGSSSIESPVVLETHFHQPQSANNTSSLHMPLAPVSASAAQPPPPPPPARHPIVVNQADHLQHQQQRNHQDHPTVGGESLFGCGELVSSRPPAPMPPLRLDTNLTAAGADNLMTNTHVAQEIGAVPKGSGGSGGTTVAASTLDSMAALTTGAEDATDPLANADQQSITTEAEKWSDSEADAIVRGARETAQMALSMYQFTRGEGSLNTTQDLFTQAELFAEEANELYKEVRCFSYKVPAGDLKKELLGQLSAIPALVQQLQFIVKNPTVGKPATFAKVDSVIRETKTLMEAVNRVVNATLSCRQHYNMAVASMRKRTRTLSPSYRGDKGFEFENQSAFARGQSGISGRGGGVGMGSEPDI